MANMGQDAMPVTINTMEVEVPLILYTHQFYNIMKTFNITDQTSCRNFYQN